jgi:uncharacterized OB-fold protein
MSNPDSRLWSSSAPAQLLASQHVRTGELVFPPVADDSPLVPQYRTTALDPIGTVYSWTVIHPAAKTGQAPYALGYVDFDGPVRIFGRLNGKERPAIGDRYRATPHADYGYAFEYAAKESAQ